MSEQTSKSTTKRDWSLMGSSYVVGLLEHPLAYMQPIDVWLAMTRRPPLHDFQESERIQWGTYLEPSIIKSFEVDNALQEPLIQNKTFINPENQRFCTTPDGVDLQNGIVKSIVLEVKNVALDRQYLWANGVPDIYFAQCQWHLYNVNAWNKANSGNYINKCYLRALFGGNSVADYEVEYNQKFVNDLVQVATHFINEFVIPDKEPPPDSSKEYSKFLSLYYPDVPDKSVKREASASSTEKIQKWALLREEAKQLDSKIQAIKNELEKEIIDNNLYGYTSLYASVSRYKVSGRAKDGEILKHLVEKHNLQTEYDELKNKPEFKGEDYHVINIYPKKLN